MMRKTTFLVGRLGLLMALLAGVIGAMPAAPHASAQAQSGQLLVRSCSAANYPSITCALAPIDITGKPITGIPAEAFEVTDGPTPVKDLSVSEATNPDTSTSTLWVVDLSGSLAAKYVSDVRTAVASSMEAKPINELVGLIALTDKIETPSNPENIPLEATRESAFSKDANTAVVNKVSVLTAKNSIALHEGIFKALLMTRKQAIGTRAIVVLTDGFDTRSQPLNIDAVVREAKDAGIPIYTFGFGAVRTNTREADKLKNLSVATGGEYVPVASNDVIVKAYRAIQNRMKTQYAVTFTAPNADKNERKFTFKLNLPDKKVDAADYLVKPQAPVVPQIEAVKFRSGDKEVDPGQTPAENVFVELTVNAQTVSQVQYQLDEGEVVLGREAPTYAYTLRAGGLEPGSTHTLLVKVFGAEGKPDQATEQKVTFTVSGAAAAVAITSVPVVVAQAPTAQPASASLWEQVTTGLGMDGLMLGALGLGLLALLVLSALIVSSLIRRRKQGMAPVTDVITSPFAPSGGFPNTVNTGFNANPISQVSQGVGRANDDPTQVFVDKGSESQPTQVLQSAKAMLEVTSGPTQGDRIPLGVPGKTVIIIGRDADPLVGDLQLKSTFVSRKHAEIHLEGDDMILVDLGSSSGTKLNGQKLNANERRKFELGAEISFADVKTKVSKPD